MTTTKLEELAARLDNYRYLPVIESVATQLRTIAAELRALAGDGWTPIESAPRDVPILLFKNGRQYVGVWARNQNTGTIGWILAELGGGNRAILERATHWRSLPPPPAKENDSHE